VEDKHPPARTQALALVLFIALVTGVTVLGSIFTSAGMDGWYANLERPDWDPPDWVFGPVWTVLYAGIAVSGWLVWRNAGWPGARLPLSLWGVQLGLNLLWTALFFGLQMPVLALVEIVVLWIAIVLTIAAFWRVSRIAAVILAPYLAWVSFAGALNYSIWTLN
jgi:translocator protein